MKKSLEYLWSDWKATISWSRIFKSWTWIVEDVYGDDTYDFHSNIDVSFKSPKEAEKDMFLDITNNIGHLPKSKF